MWLSMVCTLIDDNTRNHSGQNVVDSRGAAEWVCNKFWPLWWRISLSIRVHTRLNHIRFLFYHNIKHNEINLCLDSWKQRLGFESAPAALYKWAACTRQTFLLKPFALICRNNTDHDKPHFDLFFYHNINVKENVFLQSASWKRYCMTYWREQHGMDSYLPWQLSQSDCEISSNCESTTFWPLWWHVSLSIRVHTTLNHIRLFKPLVATVENLTFMLAQHLTAVKDVLFFWPITKEDRIYNLLTGQGGSVLR